ncbi:MAG TPA: CBS domain-containing protein [Gemmatimonadales bacterium]|nr:CBS domain-containing protein [Gemmatimonadales bacterium]
MRVADLMQEKVVTVNPETTIGEAIAAMADAHVSALPVVTSNGQVVGVISSSDILGAEAEVESAEGRASLFETTMVEELMTRSPQVIEPQASVQEAAKRMLYTEVHRLFVTEEDRLVGVISATDIVRGVAMNRV